MLEHPVFAFAYSSTSLKVTFGKSVKLIVDSPPAKGESKHSAKRVTQRYFKGYPPYCIDPAHVLGESDKVSPTFAPLQSQLSIINFE